MDVSNRNNQRTFMEIQGTIVAIEPIRTGMNRGQNCGAMIMLEDMDGNNVNFTVGPMTYVLDFATLQEGMQVGVFYRTDAPAPLIFPPQYQASVIVPDRMGVNVDVGYYNSMLVNENQTLQLNLSGDVPVLTSNNQMYLGNPANHELVVVYSMSTRSIPAQTTPDKVIVLCGNMTLMNKYAVSAPEITADEGNTVVIVAIDYKYAGHFIISDAIKDDAIDAISKLASSGFMLGVAL